MLKPNPISDENFEESALFSNPKNLFLFLFLLALVTTALASIAARVISIFFCRLSFPSPVADLVWRGAR